MPSNTTQTAHELTAEQVLTTLVQPLQAQSVFLSAGPRIIDTAGPLRIPFAPDYGTGDVPMTGEAEVIPTLSPEYADMQLLPSTMKSFKLMDRYTNELLRASFVSIDAVLRQSLVAKVAQLVDRQLMGATGDGITAPRGLGAYTGVQEITVGRALRLDDILAAQGMLLSANAPVEGLTLFIRVSDYMALRAVRDAIWGGYVIQPDVNTGKLVVPVLGANVVPTDRIATGTAYLAHMPSIVVARDVNPAVTILPERYADTDEVGIRVVSRLDAAPVQPKAIVRFKGIQAPA